MNNLAFISIFLGIVIMVVRGPLLVTPKATLQVYHRIIDTHTRIRIMGVVFALIGGIMILFAQEPQNTAAWIILGYGWYVIVFSIVFLLIFTSYYKKFAKMILDLIDSGRILGAIGVGFGAFFIWLGFGLM